MKIFSNEGVSFICSKCGLIGRANLPTDFELVICNNEEIYSITCPRCGKKWELHKADIPSSLREYIRPTILSWHHD